MPSASAFMWVLPISQQSMPELAQVVAQGHLADPQRKAVPLRAVARDVAPGVEAHPARPADRRLHVGVGEPHAHRRHAVEIGRVQMRMAGAAQIVEPQLVIHDEQDVHWSLPPGQAHVQPALTIPPRDPAIEHASAASLNAGSLIWQSISRSSTFAGQRRAHLVDEGREPVRVAERRAGTVPFVAALERQQEDHRPLRLRQPLAHRTRHLAALVGVSSSPTTAAGCGRAPLGPRALPAGPASRRNRRGRSSPARRSGGCPPARHWSSGRGPR